MINNDEGIDVYPQAEDEIETPPKSFIPIMFLIVVTYYSFTYYYNEYYSVTYYPVNVNNNNDDVTVTITNTIISFSTVSSGNFNVSFYVRSGAAIENPSGDVFYYTGTSARIFYAGQQVGSMVIPITRVTTGIEHVMEASLSVNPVVPVSLIGHHDVDVPAINGTVKITPPPPPMELELKMKRVGRKKKTTALRFFSNRHVWFVAKCRFTNDVLMDTSCLHFYCYPSIHT